LVLVGLSATLLLPSGKVRFAGQPSSKSLSVSSAFANRLRQDRRNIIHRQVERSPPIFQRACAGAMTIRSQFCIVPPDFPHSLNEPRDWVVGYMFRPGGRPSKWRFS
jgi:hypothetical protein